MYGGPSPTLTAELAVPAVLCRSIIRTIDGDFTAAVAYTPSGRIANMDDYPGD